MHKRILDYHRLLPFVLLTTLLFPTMANAAGPAGAVGKEQPPAFDRLDDPPTSSDILGFGYLYAVEAGDDLWLLAVSHGLSMESLAEVNNLKAPYWLHPGDKLWIPAAPAVIERKPVPTPTPVPTVAPVAPTPAPATEPPAEPAAEAAEIAAPSEPAAVLEVNPAPLPEASGTITVSEAVVVAGVAARQASSISDGAQLIFNLMNQKRIAYGLPALTWSDQLAAAAQAHADDCAQRGWGSHVGTDGARLRTRLGRVGYYPSWTSENWANAINAESAFNMWYWEGPGGAHYENIMGRNYTEAGIGIAQSAGWGYYYIVDFGQP